MAWMGGDRVGTRSIHEIGQAEFSSLLGAGGISVNADDAAGAR
jgi:hypothetical protein